MRVWLLPLPLVAGCSLLTVHAAPCSDNAGCREAFGLGSVCGAEGLCEIATVPPRCKTEGAPLELPVDPDLTVMIGTMFDHSLDTHVARYRSAGLPPLQVNSKEGVGGRTFSMLHCSIEEDFRGDGLSKDDAVTEMARWLADDLGVVAIIGPAASSDVESTYNTVAPYGTLVVSPSATSPSLTALDGVTSTDADPGLLWRTAPPDTVQALAIADDMMSREVPSTNVAVVYQTGAYGEGLEDAFTSAMIARGGRTTPFPFDPAVGSGDVLPEVVAGNFDEILFASSEANDVVGFLVASYAIGIDEPIFLTDSARNADVLDQAASASALFPQLRGTAPASPDGPVYASFAASYAGTYGTPVDDFSYAAHSYDASWLVMYGAGWSLSQEGRIYGEGIARGLRHLSSGPERELRPSDWTDGLAYVLDGRDQDVVGASGELDYDPNTAETTGPIEVWDIAGGGFETLYVYVP
ncbi:MAG: ABC transporter substrate-binding protein [Myxococcota bacterium]